MTEPPVVVVWRAANADHLPGIEAAGAVAEVRFAPDATTLRSALGDADAVFFFHGSKPDLEEAWPLATTLRWVQSASDGVDGLLFPALAQSDVVVTNARGVFDDAIAEWVIGAMLAMVSGPVPVLVSTTLCGAEVVPTVTVPKARLAPVGETVGPVPTPLNETTCGLPRALSLKTRKAWRKPDPEGMKLTVTEQVCPGRIVPWQSLPTTL